MVPLIFISIVIIIIIIMNSWYIVRETKKNYLSKIKVLLTRPKDDNNSKGKVSIV